MCWSSNFCDADCHIHGEDFANAFKEDDFAHDALYYMSMYFKRLMDMHISCYSTKALNLVFSYYVKHFLMWHDDNIYFDTFNVHA